MRILVPLDGSTAAEAALDHAIAFAKAFPADITLLRVISEPESGLDIRADAIDMALWRHQARAYLDSLRDRYATESLTINCVVAEGCAARTIIDSITEVEADLIILTRFGSGNAQEFTAGGTAQKIMGSATCSLLLVDPNHPYEHGRGYRRLLVPVDDRRESDCTVAIAGTLAEIHGGTILLLQVAEDPHLPSHLPASQQIRALSSELKRIARSEAEIRLTRLARQTPGTVSVETSFMTASDTALAIEETAQRNDNDLVLLHTMADGQHGGLGATNQSLIQLSHRPLFVFRPPKAEGCVSKFRSVYLDKVPLQAS